MSETIITAIVGGVVAIILLFMQNQQAIRMIKITISQQNLEKSQENLHRQINSRMDELLELTRRSAKEEGKAEEKANPTK